MDLAAVRAAYRRYAKVYDLVFGGVFGPGRRRTLKQINRMGGRRVLEVGVGTGLSLPQHRADNTIVGIDASAEMLEIARKRVATAGLTNVEALVEMDACNLDFPDGSFDVVVAMYVMSVVPDPQRCLREMRRVCKPGGEILMINHYAAEEPGIRLTFEKLIAPLADKLGWHPDFTMGPLLGNAGVEIASVQNVAPFGLFTLVECRNTQPLSTVQTVAAPEGVPRVGALQPE
ncbi:MAG TPA: class I SAM-dependent methyltransferase [Alphaproteobacteria bacterium]|nr:class I SAM-dependent methyltransferase [Alphaproteobacteria bacterium]